MIPSRTLLLVMLSSCCVQLSLVWPAAAGAPRHSQG